MPNFLSQGQRDALPEWLSGETVHLGLDLRGGVHLLLEIDVDGYMAKQTSNLRSDIRTALKERQIGYRNFQDTDGAVLFTIRRETLGEHSVGGVIRPVDPQLEIEEEGDRITVRFSEMALREKRAQLMAQSIEIINRRVNEMGTTEPTIQRQGMNRVLVQVPGLDDPQTLKDIIGKTAKMSFHLGEYVCVTL